MSERLPTNAEAVRAAKVLVAYYRELGRRLVIDEFCDRMVIGLSKEIEKIPTRPSVRP